MAEGSSGGGSHFSGPRRRPQSRTVRGPNSGAFVVVVGPGQNLRDGQLRRPAGAEAFGPAFTSGRSQFAGGWCWFGHESNLPSGRCWRLYAHRSTASSFTSLPNARVVHRRAPNKKSGKYQESQTIHEIHPCNLKSAQLISSG
jgi:hypothetical protein